MKKAIPHNPPIMVCLFLTDSKLICYSLYRAGITARAAVVSTSIAKVAFINRDNKHENCNTSMLYLLLYGVIVPFLNPICLRHTR